METIGFRFRRSRCSTLLSAGGLAFVLGVGVWGGPAEAGGQLLAWDPLRKPEIRVAALSLGAFYDALSPYGDWISVGAHGRVWRPHAYVVGTDFQPYSTRGHWVYTDYGWSFESDFEWGWAPFHYGRWYVDQDYGWVWAPDTTWGPAWVDWREGSGYVGWAPLPPTGIRVVVDRAHPYWCFVPTGRLMELNVRRWSVPSPRIHDVYGMTVASHEQISYSGARWYAGPLPARIGAALGRPIASHSVVPPPPGRVQPARSAPPPATRYGAPWSSPPRSLPAGGHSAPLPPASSPGNVHHP